MKHNPARIREMANGRNEIISSQLDESDISSLLADKTLRILQTKIPLTKQTLNLLNDQFFSLRKDVQMRFYYVCETLSFLKELPNIEQLTIEEKYPEENRKNINDITALSYVRNLKTLRLDLHKIKDIAVLSDLRQLKNFHLSFSKPLNISLKPIENLPLQELGLGKVKNFDSVAHLKKLKSLALASIPINDSNIAPLLELRELENFSYYGTTKSTFHLLPKIGKIKHLSIKNASIDNFNFIAEMDYLEALNLQYLSKLEKLPSLKRLDRLKIIDLWSVENLKDISTLPQAINLEEFRLNQTKNFMPEDFRILSQLPKLKIVNIHFGAKKRDDEFEQLLAELKLKRYPH